MHSTKLREHEWRRALEWLLTCASISTYSLARALDRSAPTARTMIYKTEVLMRRMCLEDLAANKPQLFNGYLRIQGKSFWWVVPAVQAMKFAASFEPAVGRYAEEIEQTVKVAGTTCAVVLASYKQQVKPTEELILNLIEKARSYPPTPRKCLQSKMDELGLTIEDYFLRPGGKQG